MLRNPIYTGDFLWIGKRRKGSHQPLVSHDVFVGCSRSSAARHGNATPGASTPSWVS
jgi:hypothetical protein